MKKIVKYKMPKRPQDFFIKNDVLSYFIKLEDEDRLGILPENLLNFYVYDTFQNEVNNGGLEQYFSNISCNQSKYLSKMAKWTKNTDFIALIEKALNCSVNDYECIENIFFEISDKVEESVKAAYKENYVQEKVAIERVKEKPSEYVKYFCCDKVVDLTQALITLTNFIEELENNNWNIELLEFGNNIKISVGCNDKGLDLLEILSNFANESYSFSNHKAITSKNDRINLSFFKNISIISTIDITNNIKTDYAVNITPSGFEKNEYQIKYSFMSRAMQIDKTKPLKFSSRIVFGDFIDGCFIKNKDLEKIKEVLLARVKNIPNIKSVSYEKFVVTSLSTPILLYKKD